MTTEKICRNCNEYNQKYADFCAFCGERIDYSVDEKSDNVHYFYGTNSETYDAESYYSMDKERPILGQNKVATTSFIFGLLAITILPGIGGLIALILGLIAYMNKRKGYQYATVGMILGGFSIIISIAISFIIYFILTDIPL